MIRKSCSCRLRARWAVAPRSSHGAFLFVCAMGLSAFGCDRKPSPEQTPTQGRVASPNASILPAPLASAGELMPERSKGAAASAPSVGLAADSAGHLIFREAEPPPPEPINVSEALPRDTLSAADAAVGLTLNARWRFHDVPDPPEAPQVDPAAIKAAEEAVAPMMTIDLAYAGRMRIALTSIAFPLPAGAEIRARADRYGHALVWPNGRGYRLLAPGSLRALFGERRPDVTPLVRAKAKPLGSGKLHGLSTTKSEVKTAMGALTLEQASIAGSGRSGALLCQFLVELVAADPASNVCRAETVPLAAHYAWEGGGRIDFDVLDLSNRTDLPVGVTLVPPPAAEFKPGALPLSGSGVFLTLEQLRKFRKAPIELDSPPGPEAPGEGIMAVNHGNVLTYLLVDGVPTAWVKPNSQRYIIGPRRGRYGISWRDFFGTRIEPQRVVGLPARLEVGGDADAGLDPP